MQDFLLKNNFRHFAVIALATMLLSACGDSDNKDVDRDASSVPDTGYEDTSQSDGVSDDADTHNTPDAGNCTSFDTVGTSITSAVTVDGCYQVNSDITVTGSGHLTIMPGSTLYFAQNVGIRVDGGKLTANGTADDRILFTGQTPTPGFWRGVQFRHTASTDNQLTHVTIDGGGSAENFSQSQPANLMVLGKSTVTSTLKIENTTLKNSGNWGLYVAEDSKLAGFSQNTLTTNELGPALVHVTAVNDLDAASDYSGNTADLVEISGTSLKKAATWSALNVPYYVPAPITVKDEGSDLRIEAGAVLEFGENSGLEMLNSATLNADGTEEAPIVFRGRVATAGYWAGIKYENTISSKNKLNYVTIDGGGSESTFSSTQPANLMVTITSSKDTQITLTNSTLKNSANWGLYVRGGGTFADFSQNTITANTLGPAYVNVTALGSIQSDSDFSGNDIDLLKVAGTSLKEPATWSALNVPYHISESITLKDEGTDITIEAGAEFEFDENKGIEVISSATLNADGTESAPIIFRGRDSAAGYWAGIKFGKTVSSKNKLNYVTIDGGGSQFTFSEVQSANLMLARLSSQPTQISLTNATLTNSGNGGVYVADKASFSDCGNLTGVTAADFIGNGPAVAAAVTACGM